MSRRYFGEKLHALLAQRAWPPADLASERETHRHVSAAADRWREALEKIALHFTPPARAGDFTLSEVPHFAITTLRACHSEIKKLTRSLDEQTKSYVYEVRAKRVAQIERDRLKAALTNIINSESPGRAIEAAAELLK